MIEKKTSFKKMFAHVGRMVTHTPPMDRNCNGAEKLDRFKNTIKYSFTKQPSFFVESQ